MRSRRRALAVLPAAALALACTPPADAPGRAAGNSAPASPAAPSAPPGAGEGFAGIPNLEISHYDVGGDSPAEIRRALDRVRPRDPNDGLRVDALSRWSMQWRWPVGGEGGCDLARAEIRFSASVRMPRLVAGPRTPEAVRRRWRVYAAALERHEAGHIRNAWRNMGRVLAAIRASSCAAADRAARAAVAGIARWDLAYDRTTRHGLTQGAHFP